MVWTETRVREMGHQSYSTEPQTPNLLLLKSSNSDKYKDCDRRLALYYPFFTAQPKHMRKYASLMTTVGIDVLVVKSNLKQLLNPEKGSQVIADQVKAFLNEHLPCYDSVMLYVCSVGCYLFSESSIKINGDTDLRSKLNSRMKSQIWECPISIGEMSVGLARSVSRNKFIQSMITRCTRLYFKMYCESTTQHFIAAYDFSFEHPYTAPCLTLCSDGDHISPPLVSEAGAKLARKKGVDTTVKIFNGVPHCQNFNYCPKEYKETFYRFLHSTGMISEEDLGMVLQS